MRFQIENVGKVHRAKINVDGITVVAGYNNSGKTTILRSTDVLLKTYCNLSENIWKERIKSLEQVILKQKSIFNINGYGDWSVQLLYRIAEEIRNDIRRQGMFFIRWERFYEIYSKALEDYVKEMEIPEEGVISEVIPTKIYEKLEEIFLRTETKYNKYLAEINLRKVFCQQASNLLNRNESRIEARTAEQEQVFRIVFQGGRATDVAGGDLGQMPVIYIETSNVLDGISSRRDTQDSAQELKELLRRERSYNRDEITFEQYQETEKNLDLLDDIFQEVLHGRLQSESDTVKYKEDSMEEAVNIANVASGMKIFLIFRRLIENGSLTENSWVLIDEPESNLHPEWHLKLAEILILLNMKMNIHILLSSHSPYFIRALEVKLADYGIKDKGRFYLMEETGNMFDSKDVTECTEEIYSQLYKPLELL